MKNPEIAQMTLNKECLTAPGGPPKQLTDLKSDLIFRFDWSRDGKRLILARGTLSSDVVLISDVK